LAVVIRLKRLGAKKRPTYRFVATDSRMPRDGRFIETLGYYNPIEKPAKVKIDEERMVYWLNEGAQPSDTVKSLMQQVGFIKKYEMIKKGEDVSSVTIAETITERPKKRKKKKGAKTE
jgi:small subunit ribosomal protein S16